MPEFINEVAALSVDLKQGDPLDGVAFGIRPTFALQGVARRARGRLLRIGFPLALIAQVVS